MHEDGTKGVYFVNISYILDNADLIVIKEEKIDEAGNVFTESKYNYVRR